MRRCVMVADTSRCEMGLATSASIAETPWAAPSATSISTGASLTEPQEGGPVPREIRCLVVALACAGIVVAGCKQKSKEEADPGPAASASAPPPATAEAPPQPEAIPPPPAPPGAVAPAAGSAKGGGSGESLKTCCAALHKQADSATPDKKSNLQQTANACDAISKLVAAGTTKKASALSSLRASMRGGALPAGCN
jgi:hypothetical protein